MALVPIKGTITNLEDVFVSTEESGRYVTDRYSLWRLDGLEGRSKLAETLRLLPDGCYTVSAGGAARVNTSYTAVPTCARLIPEEWEDELLERTDVLIDHDNSISRVYLNAAGPVLLNNQYVLTGATVKRARGKSVAGIFHKDELTGIIMPRRWNSVDVGRIAEVMGSTSGVTT